MAVWDDPDVDLLFTLNGLTETAPAWADRAVRYASDYGMFAGLLLLGLLAWWRVVRRKPTRAESVSALAGLLWTPLAAAVALLANIPVRDLVARPSPVTEHPGLHALAGGTGGEYSFVSDHSAVAMALAIGIFMVHRRYGLLGIALAVLTGATRVYLGVHYPTDAVGGLALGACVALLLAPPASWALTPLARRLANAPRTAGIVWAGSAGRDGDGTADDSASEPGQEPERAVDATARARAAGRSQRDLAA
jgi:undecaprenyl-diphosphatase